MYIYLYIYIFIQLYLKQPKTFNSRLNNHREDVNKLP